VSVLAWRFCSGPVPFCSVFAIVPSSTPFQHV
jgi:hypothetical protein